MDSPLLKYSAKDYFFKAALCHFCIDMLNAKVSPPRPCPTHLVAAPETLGPLSGCLVPHRPSAGVSPSRTSGHWQSVSLDREHLLLLLHFCP